MSRARRGSLHGCQACGSARRKPLPKQRAPTTPLRQLICNTGLLQQPLLNWDLGQLLTSWVSVLPSTPLSHRIMRIARVSVSHLPGAGEPQEASICWPCDHPSTMTNCLWVWAGDGGAAGGPGPSPHRDHILVAGTVTDEKCIRYWKVLDRDL